MIQLNFPNAVTDEKDFYGRRAELERISEVLLSNQRLPVVIMGERRIGKTSLQNIAVQRLRAAEPGYIPVFVEPRGITSLDEFAEAIFQRLCTHLKKGLQETGLLGEDARLHLETPSQFKTAFLQLQGPASRETILLCVDEFEEIIRKADLETGGRESARIDALTHALVEETDLPVRLLFTMTRLPESVQKSYPTPLTHFSEIIELRPFTPGEMNEMLLGITQEALIFSAPEKHWLFGMSGGHPYFAKLLLANLVERQKPSKLPAVVDQAMLALALQAAIQDPRANHVLENIYKVHFSDHEKRVMLWLAERGRPVAAAEFKAAGLPLLTAARTLVRRDYLVEQEGRFEFQIKLLGRWLQNWIEFEEELERFDIWQSSFI